MSQAVDDHCHRPTLERLPKSLPVVASPAAAKAAEKLGFTSVQSVAHGEEVTVCGGRLRVRATAGALVGPPWSTRENGYVLSETVPGGIKLYYEPHCDFKSGSVEEVGQVDVVVTPPTSQVVLGFPLVKGATENSKLLPSLRPKVIIPLFNASFPQSGPLANLIKEQGSLEELEAFLADTPELRGCRGESVRLTLALAGVDSPTQEGAAEPGGSGGCWESPFVASSSCPLYEDEHVQVADGASAAARHLGRKYNLYGSTLRENALVDFVLDAVDDIRRKYLVLAYGWQLLGVVKEAAKDVYFRDVINPATSDQTQQGGTDFQRLSKLISDNSSRQGWAVGETPSIADVMLYDIVDLHCRMFGCKAFSQAYPDLMAFRGRFAALPRIHAYLEAEGCSRDVSTYGDTVPGT
ncbi:hypothetical protein N2152v2_007187 [Parachlorella kessleri]